MLSFSERVDEASWLVNHGTDPEQLISFGPKGYPGFARVLFLADPTGSSQAEFSAGDIPGGLTKLEVLVRTVTTLSRFTRTADQGFFTVWDSGASAPNHQRERAKVAIPLRPSFLVEGPLLRLPSWHQDLGLKEYDHPALIWPADRAWCVAADVEPHWAGIGASREALAAVEADPLLSVERADPSKPQPRYV